MCCESGAVRTLERARDTYGATGERWLVKEHEPDTAGRHASLLLPILSYAVTDDTRGSLDTLDLLVQKFESSTGTPLLEPHKVALLQRKIKGTDVLNHLVMHASPVTKYASIHQVRIDLRRGPQHHADESNAAGQWEGQRERQEEGQAGSGKPTRESE